jgi:hypothetical protein
MIDSWFSIPQENEKPAFRALLGNFEELHKECAYIDEALWEFQWELCRDNNGTIEGISFHGESEDEEASLFSILAPYVTSGSYIDCMLQSELVIWRWLFYEGKLYEQKGKVTFPEERGDPIQIEEETAGERKSG